MLCRINALSIDVEDWFYPELVREKVRPEDAKDRIEISIKPLLSLLDRYHVKGTFFFLGEVAERHPRLVQKLYEEGHEIGCHGMSHLPLWRLTKEEFEREIESFTRLMKGILGNTKIQGFRAPTFSLDEKTQWALPILKDFGFSYDASLFPARLPGNDVYGVDGGPKSPYHVSFDDFLKEDPKNPFIEFPNTILQVGSFPLPLGGGFYLRALPLWVLIAGLRRVNRRAPFNLYIHPWELDPGIPRVPLGFKDRWITYYRIPSALKKLEGLLRRFSFSRVDLTLASYLQPRNPV
jgi:polysaccharide deacetylase family protein (PEP-CTERM system associated)